MYIDNQKPQQFKLVFSLTSTRIFLFSAISAIKIGLFPWLFGKQEGRMRGILKSWGEKFLGGEKGRSTFFYFVFFSFFINLFTYIHLRPRPLFIHESAFSILQTLRRGARISQHRQQWSQTKVGRNEVSLRQNITTFY